MGWPPRGGRIDCAIRRKNRGGLSRASCAEGGGKSDGPAAIQIWETPSMHGVVGLCRGRDARGTSACPFFSGTLPLAIAVTWTWRENDVGRSRALFWATGRVAPSNLSYAMHILVKPALRGTPHACIPEPGKVAENARGLPPSLTPGARVRRGPHQKVFPDKKFPFEFLELLASRLNRHLHLLFKKSFYLLGQNF